MTRVAGRIDMDTHLTGDFLNLDKRDLIEETLPCSSSEDSTAIRGFLVRPRKYGSC